MLVVSWPIEFNSYKGVEIIYRDREIEMLNPRFGMIKTDKKATRDNDHHKRYKLLTIDYFKLTEEASIAQDLMREATGNYEYTISMNGADLCRDFEPVFKSGVGMREEALYDVIDVSNGFVLVRTFKGNCRRFIETLLKEGYYFVGEEVQDVQKWGPKRIEQINVGIYKGTNGGIIRAYTKMEVKKIED